MAHRLVLAAALASAATAAVAEPVYIPLGAANSILMVESSDDRVIGRIEGVSGVHGLAAAPGGQYLIAGSADERPAAQGAPDKPEAVSEEEHATHHPQPGAGIEPASGMVSTVSIIDTATRAVVRRIDVSGGVHHVAADPLGRFAVVTHPALGRITVIDLSTFTVTAEVATGPFPNYAAFSPDGGTLYVSNAGNRTVSEVDVDRWIVRRNALVGESPEHLVLSADGDRLYVNNVDAGTVSVIATRPFEVVDTLAAGAPLHGLDLSDDGGTLFVAVMGEDRLVAFRLDGSAGGEVELAPSPYHVAAIAGTGKLYVSSDVEPKLWVVDQDTLALRGEVEIGGKGHQMVWTPAP